MIKEVANVYFEALAADKTNNIEEGDIVLFLDSLKVSTIEQTAEQADARGGWGNPKLVSWDYGKEITVTLEDALMSMESLRFMLGGAIKRSSANKKAKVRLTEQGVMKTADTLPDLYDHLNENFKYVAPTTYRWINMTAGTRGNQDNLKGAVGDVIRVMWEVETATDDAAVEITISPNTFPGTYRVIGDTFIRSEKTGKDEAFQFQIGKAKNLVAA